MIDSEFSPGESLLLIRNMISKTREGIYDNSKYFLIWGWGAFLACLGQFVLKVVYHRHDHYKVWFITFVCIILTVFISFSDRKRVRVKTYVGESMAYLWTGLGITFFVFSLVFMKIGWQYCYPFYMILYGLGTFVSGKVLNFIPLVIGGLVSFALAAVSVWLEYDVQVLCAAGALLASYIIPSHLLRLRFQKARRIANEETLLRK
jgi:hypothetical protein